MFHKYRMVSTVKISPKDLDKNITSVVQFELNKRYANSVLKNVGLFVTIYEPELVGKQYVDEGFIWGEYQFSAVVFSPEVGMVMSGVVESISEEVGIRVNLGFFRNVIIQRKNFKENSTIEEEEGREGIFIWQYDQDTRLVISVGDKIVFKVTAVKYGEIDEKEKRGGSENLMVVYGSISDGYFGKKDWFYW